MTIDGSYHEGACFPQVVNMPPLLSHRYQHAVVLDPKFDMSCPSGSSPWKMSGLVDSFDLESHSLHEALTTGAVWRM